MQAPAHLKLIVSASSHEASDEGVQDRMSMIQPVSNLRLRVQWLRHHAGVLALWSTTALLLAVAGLLLASRF